MFPAPAPPGLRVSSRAASVPGWKGSRAAGRVRRVAAGLRARPTPRTSAPDSLANAETLSLSGAKVGRFADMWLTQWPHLERPDGPRYLGSVL